MVSKSVVTARSIVVYIKMCVLEKGARAALYALIASKRISMIAEIFQVQSLDFFRYVQRPLLDASVVAAQCPVSAFGI